MADREVLVKKPVNDNGDSGAHCRGETVQIAALNGWEHTNASG
jgi:hypothetical protein